jgi:tetratricopeptide (TPR) repeat protein
VLLERLPPADCELLMNQLGDGLGPEAHARVIAASDGNPLFLEEMTALARERGTVTVPPTIHALLAARLERLPVEERELLERGAVEGEVFHRLALRALAGNRAASDLERAIAGLVRKELIRPHPPTIEPDEAFRFRHLLIRDAAYDRLAKATRSKLHELFAGWLDDNARELAELDEIVGWHLEQAVRYQRELGREVDPALTHRAAERIHAAGRRASERGDVAAATNLLERVLELASEDSTLRATAAVDLAELLIDVGDLTRVDALLNTAGHDQNAADLAALTRFEWMVHAQPQDATREIRRSLPRILERFTIAADTRGLAKAHWVASQLHWLATQATAAGEELRLAAAYALKAGDRGMRSRALGEYMKTLVYGREDAPTLAREVAMIEDEEDLGPYLRAFLDLARAELRRLQGNLDDARRFTHRAIDGFGALGMGAVQGGLWQDLGQTELSAGDPAAALAALLRSDAILAQLEERAFRSTTQALLADAYERLGSRDEARVAIELSDELSATEDVLNYVNTHQVRARLALAEGDRAGAESWARSATEYASRTDFLRSIAQARLNLARVLLAVGSKEHAIVEAREALELYNAKGDQPGVADARACLETLSRAV